MTEQAYQQIHQVLLDEMCVSKKVLQCCGELSIFKHAVAAEWDGLDDGFQELHQAHQQLAELTGDAGLLLAINAHLWGAVFPLMNFAKTSQQADWLPGLLSGELIGGHAITEADSGSDVSMMTTQAVETSTGFCLNGCKLYITNAAIADLIIVYAKLNQHISAFIVRATDQGADFSQTMSCQGFASASLGRVGLTDCVIPKDRLLGQRGAGSQLIQAALSLERAFIFSGISGVMKKQLQDVVKYVNQRPILHNKQILQHKIVDMRLRLDTLELWLKHCAEYMDNGKRIFLISSQIKALAGDYFLQSSQDALHILGALGFTEQAQYSQWLLDAMACRLISGSSEIQKHILAAQMGLSNVKQPG